MNPNPKVTASIIFLDPKKAKELFESNADNQRNVKPANLRKIEGAIRSGKFALNGESIIRSETGRLLNGQHRVIAVMNTGIGVWTVLVEGVSDDCFATMDSGSSRSMADVCRIAGDGDVNNLSATIQRLAEYMEGADKIGLSIPFSHAQLWDVREVAQGVENSISAVRKSHRFVSISRAAWLHYVGQQECPAACEQFFQWLGDTSNTKKPDAIYLLQKRGADAKLKKAPLPLREQMAILIKAWNAFVEDKPISVLRWSEREAFPQIRFRREARRGILRSA